MPQIEYEQVAANVRRARMVETTEEQTARLAAEDLRSKVLALAQSAVGVALNDLTVAQQKALLVALLWRAGGLTPDLKVKPLSEWLRG